MALIPMKPLSQSCSLESVAADHKASRRVEQFRVGAQAVYFPAFPGDRYLPYAAVERVRSKNTAISVIGTCGNKTESTGTFNKCRRFKGIHFHKHGKICRGVFIFKVNILTAYHTLHTCKG